LVVGPTGSGKTTTLYAALSVLNNQSRNITTIEDPIEYYIDGINQTQKPALQSEQFLYHEFHPPSQYLGLVVKLPLAL
jgi:type II secretory ATPase GspE/PulE/Tfp pilus assembly ATPase PilB-like protein